MKKKKLGEGPTGVQLSLHVSPVHFKSQTQAAFTHTCPPSCAALSFMILLLAPEESE